jgi:hypothetical protein
MATNHLYRPGSITNAAVETVFAIREGRLPPINPQPRLEYVHPLERISADRTLHWGLLLWLDFHHDYWSYGDTQQTAPEGVLHHASPYYGHSYDNNPFSATFRHRTYSTQRGDPRGGP